MGRFNTWLLIAFAMNLMSLFFIQLKSRWAAITQIFNIISISAFIVALTLVREYNYSSDFSLSVLDKRILLFAAVAHFLAQYFLFFRRNQFSPWWSFFGQLSLWGLFIFMASQNIILTMSAYFLMVLSLFTFIVRSPERHFLLTTSSYFKQTITLFFAGLSLILFVLGTGSTQLLPTTVLHVPLVYLSLCLLFFVIFIEANIFPFGQNLLHLWQNHYSHLFYAQFIIKPALLWCLLTRFKMISNSLNMETTLRPFCFIICAGTLIYWIFQSFKAQPLRNRISVMLRINYILFLTTIIMPLSIKQNAILAFSLLSVGTAAASLLSLVYNQNMSEDVITGLYYKNKLQTLFILFFSGSLLGLPLTSTFYFRYLSFSSSWQNSIALFVFNILAVSLLIRHFYFIAQTLFNKTETTQAAPFIEKYRLILATILFLVTLYGGFWPFIRL